MPELPEVETTRRMLAPTLEQACISHMLVRRRDLRWPIPEGLESTLQNQTLRRLQRRAKYLLFEFEAGTMIWHLGMSGNLRLFAHTQLPPAQRHDHVEVHFTHGWVMRYRDPRRFGAVLWHQGPPENHALLRNLGPEPWALPHDGLWLQQQLARRQQAIKLAIMDQHLITGMGNIYANEALFSAGIHPQQPARDLRLDQIVRLQQCMSSTLDAALKAGGSSLRDFIQPTGEPGYFQMNYHVYGRGGLPCRQCQQPLQEIRLGGRTTVFCLQCQQQL